MAETEFQLALNQLLECIRTRDDDEVENVFMELESVTLELERWPEEFVDGLGQLMRDPSFLSLGKSWNLFYFINNNWEQISERKKERIRPILADAFDNCGDWMGAFVIGEILGERYADKETLAVLTLLAKAQGLHWRELVPHALETLAKTTEEESLRGRSSTESVVNSTTSKLGKAAPFLCAMSGSTFPLNPREWNSLFRQTTARPGKSTGSVNSPDKPHPIFQRKHLL